MRVFIKTEQVLFDFLRIDNVECIELANSYFPKTLLPCLLGSSRQCAYKC